MADNEIRSPGIELATESAVRPRSDGVSSTPVICRPVRQTIWLPRPAPKRAGRDGLYSTLEGRACLFFSRLARLEGVVCRGRGVTSMGEDWELSLGLELLAIEFRSLSGAPKALATDGSCWANRDE
ncbi:hypothetical protein Pmar_PMAR002021 [Perkinsus marinus ATCC 50983]|uniref:Uncharacterized protein n=1 Tax=Perkinsus marinus (strain ATCC 50983 / TXsc) TaxID=423536 RepID=C5LYG5_PERM5|nr:hypothetical protein Pmar_PMAR002021 [Perkinsus marinus ATCC 50983]EEQ98203.1 hypothetical protein Pmar_PMAR002021 [Perkinsus marinus ATCC 50983]|eukprot:XP_002765486.1 hypothetical protein Pmar_PMAR002021 [Perkinsus marinus ATCC 50983]